MRRCGTLSGFGLRRHAVMSYLLNVYFSAAVLTPDALGLLEGVRLGR